MLIVPDRICWLSTTSMMIMVKKTELSNTIARVCRSLPSPPPAPSLKKPPRTIADPKFTTSRIPGIFQPQIPRSAQFWLIFGVDDRQFDRKLLGYFPKHGIYKNVWHHKIGILWRLIPMPGTWGISGAIRAPIANLVVRFWVPVDVMSTPTENIVLNGCFSKISILITIWACNLAGSGWSRFLPQVSGWKSD